MGERGVTEVLTILRKELDMTMGLCGIREARRIDRSNVILPDRF
jgi:L-lactate dehydrogenase (cytochrome)